VSAVSESPQPQAAKSRFLVGVISDTHGLLRPEALDALRGCNLIIHAGDVGKAELLEPLRAIAPTFAVRGNIDRGAWAARLPATELVTAGELLFFVLHDMAELDLSGGFCGGRVRTHAPPLDRDARRRALPQPRQRRPTALRAAGIARARAGVGRGSGGGDCEIGCLI
jgi:Calcineurin-like phosphoesterase superfamily domain